MIFATIAKKRKNFDQKAFFVRVLSTTFVISKHEETVHARW
jgi:hypothetical protein